jgi:hypothetical protein
MIVERLIEAAKNCSMKTPNHLLDFTQQSWMPKVRELQRLQADVTAAFKLFNLHTQADYELLLNEAVLHIKTSAALSARMRQMTPDLLTALNEKSWNLQSIEIIVQRNAKALAASMPRSLWVNPNQLRYGKRQLPNEAQAALLARFVHSKKTKTLKSNTV